jgi:molybdenum cofactor cytidylyltransferase
MPDVSPELIADITAAFDPAQCRAICVATVKGERGHPVLWGRQFFSEMEELRGDSGARGLMVRHADLLCEVDAGDDAPLTDIDTHEALAAHTR